MESTPFTEVLARLVQDEGPRLLRDPARLQISLQARIGRSRDDEVSNLVKVLKTPGGQQLITTGTEAGFSPEDWGRRIAPEAGLSSAEASEVSAMILTAMGAGVVASDVSGGVLNLPTTNEVAPSVMGTLRSAETSAVVQIAYSPNGVDSAIGDAAMGLTLMHGGSVAWVIDLGSKSPKALSLQRIRRVQFDATGRTMVIALSDRLLAIDVATGGEIWTYSPPNLFGFLLQGPSDAVFLSEDQILTPFDEGSFNVWNIGGWSERRRRTSIAPRLVAMLSDGSGFVGSDGSQTWIWDLPGFGRRYRLTYDRVYALASLHTKPIVAVRTLDQLQIIDAKVRQTIATVDVDPGLPLIAASPTADVFAIGAEFGATLIDVHGNLLGSAQVASGGRLTALAFDSTGSILALGGIDGEVTYAPVHTALPSSVV